MTNKLTLIITLSITFSTIYSVENSYIDQQEIYSQEIEAEIETQNQSTVLTLETELYGTLLKDAESLHLNWYKEGTRTGKIQNTAVITKNNNGAWPVQRLQDTMENYPTVYDPKLHESLLHHIKDGSALLCNNIPRSSYLKDWGSSYAIILNSKKPSDCDKIRELMKEDKIKKYFDAYNAKKAAQK